MYTGCRKNDCYKKQDGKRNTYLAAFKSYEVQRLLNVNRYCHIVKKLGQKFKAEWIIIQDQQFYVHYTFECCICVWKPDFYKMLIKT